MSSAQMAALEEQLFASGLPVETLMEKAALAVAQRLRQPDWWPQLQQRGALVLVGPGHNGGDGLVVARELHLAGVAVRLWCPFERRKPLTEAHWRHAQWLGLAVLEQAPAPNDPAIWIDALFGIGQQRPLPTAIGTLLEQRRRIHNAPLLAIDLPSGLCADSGQPLGGGTACATLTCCIGLVKQGLVQDSALAWVGSLERIELGLPARLLADVPDGQPLLLHPQDADLAPWPSIPEAASKYSRGRLLVVAGSDAFRGAAHLCLLGASAAGCGSLHAVLPRAVADQLWQHMPHVVVRAALDSAADGGLNLAGLPASTLERQDVVVLGPGLGSGLGSGSKPGSAPEAQAAADWRPEADDNWKALQSTGALLVLDADGLNRLAQSADAQGWLRHRSGPTWLTPHRGEFARLFPDLADQPALIGAARAAERCGCSVLLKGARTVVAAADGRRWQLGSAEPSAARAGLGDVLAGYCAGRAARALAAGGSADASLLAAAALEHALAGQRATEAAGAGGATPMAVAEALQAHTC